MKKFRSRSRRIMRFVLFASWLLPTCFSSFSTSPAFGQVTGENAREAFRKFYQPLVPRLQASYSNVEYRISIPGRNRKPTRIYFFTGRIGDEDFELCSYPTVWTRVESITNEFLNSEFPAKDTMYQVVVIGRGKLFRVGFTSGEADIVTRKHEWSIWADAGNPILAPAWCVSLVHPFSKLHERRDVKFIEFSEGPGRDGSENVKRLLFRPPGFPKECVFETGFDANTGACLYQYEYGQQLGTGDYVPKLISIEYSASSDNVNLLPKPLYVRAPVIDKSSTEGGSLIVLDYKQLGVLPDDAFMPSSYGFENSVLDQPATVAEHVTLGIKSLLIVLVSVAGIVLITIVLLVGLIKICARSGKRV